MNIFSYWLCEFKHLREEMKSARAKVRLIKQLSNCSATDLEFIEHKIKMLDILNVKDFERLYGKI